MRQEKIGKFITGFPYGRMARRPLNTVFVIDKFVCQLVPSNIFFIIYTGYN